MGVKPYTCNSCASSFNFNWFKLHTKIGMSYIVFEYDLKTDAFGKVIKRGLTKEKAKSLVSELGVGYSYGEKSRMITDFNLK